MRKVNQRKVFSMFTPTHNAKVGSTRGGGPPQLPPLVLMPPMQGKITPTLNAQLDCRIFQCVLLIKGRTEGHMTPALHSAAAAASSALKPADAPGSKSIQGNDSICILHNFSSGGGDPRCCRPSGARVGPRNQASCLTPFDSRNKYFQRTVT